MAPPAKSKSTTVKNKKSSVKKRKKPSVRGVLSKKKLLEAIKGTGGIITQIAERAKCSRQVVYKYKDKYPEIKKAIEDEEDAILDVCEEGLFAKIYAQDFDAIKYYLSKKGHKRGYGEGPGFAGTNDPDKGGVLVVPAVLSTEAWAEAAKQATERKRQAGNENS